jgi:hypothetical protein
MSKCLIIKDGLKCLELSNSCEKVDNLILFHLRQVRDAELIEAVFHVVVESTDVQAISWVYLRDGAACQWTFHVK